MSNWKNIHPNFTPILQGLWEQHDFNYEQVEKWMKFGLEPTEYDLASYSRDERGMNIEVEQNLNLAELRKEYVNNLDWKNISYWCFTPELQREWEEKGFDYNGCKKWIDVGLRITDVNFVDYLRQKHTSPKNFLSSFVERGRVQGEIELIRHFSTKFSPNCAIIVSKKNNGKFDANLLVYDGVEKTPWCIKFFSTFFWEDAIAKSKFLEEKLMSDSNNPILDMFEIGNKPIYLSKVIKKIKLPEDIENLDVFAKEYDIIGIKEDRVSVEHTVIFLGKNKIAYVESKNDYSQMIRNGDVGYRVQVSTWENFSKKLGKTREIVLYRPIIPLKKSELIRRHIDIAIATHYELGEYSMFGRNCEYFAPLCVTSIPFSNHRVNKFTLLGWLRGGKLGEEWLRKEVKRNNKHFIELEENRKNLEDINKEYNDLHRKDEIIQEKIVKINSATSEEEVNETLMQLSFLETNLPNLSMENLVQTVIELAKKQKEFINSVKNQLSSCRNILLIGRTGNGKSTLANVLVNKEENFVSEGKFEEIFKESDSMVSETKNMQSGKFEYKGIEYRIVDTIGIGDTKLPEEEVLDRLAKTAHLVKNGLYQILFVVKGRFDESEKKAYELLKLSIFDDDITKYTTIVRTNFSGFKKKKKCEEELKLLIEENEVTANIVNSCNNRIIYIDNPSLNHDNYDDDEIEMHKKRRKDSRNYLLDHLETCQEIYRPDNLYKLVIKISKPMMKLEELERERNELEQRMWKETDENITRIIKQNIEEVKDKINTIKTEIHNQVKQDLKDKRVYNKWLSEVIEKKMDVKWIPYEQFDNIEHIAEGGFGKVYRAEWKKNSHHTWVALKILNNSQDIDEDFLQEVTHHELFNDDVRIVKCYGISQDPYTKNYLMVMKYIRDGNLRQHLGKLKFDDKFTQLKEITEGLSVIHKQGLIHKDFHPGNILNNLHGSNLQGSYITDLGLSRPAGTEDKEEKIYGVLPYVAPEILRGKLYTQKADIYSFGIIAYEVLSGMPPYHNSAHNEFLALKVCQGLRPDLNRIQAPQLLKDLIKKCWDANPSERPAANELHKSLMVWYRDILHKRETEFYQQYQEAEKSEVFRKSSSVLPNTIPFFTTHPQAVYTSRLLDFSNLTRAIKF